MRITRRTLQVSLGVVWLLDGALQLQPVMFTRRFADGIIAPTGAGEPAPLHWAVAHAAALIASQPIAFDAVFAAVQLALGIGLLWRRTARLALGASIVWALGVWALGEGLGQVLTGSATALSGAPGAALLYAVLAVAAWPSRDGRVAALAGGRWLPITWAATWALLAALALLPGTRSGAEVSSSLTTNLAGLPGFLSSASRSLARTVAGAGTLPAIVMAAAFAAVAVLGVASTRTRAVAATGGCLLALAIWALAEGFGGIAGGQATDPNSGPLLVLFAATLASWGTPAGRPVSAGALVRPGDSAVEATRRVA